MRAENDDIRKYDDIINLPHYQSKTRPHMSVSERAAQFAPFAPLTGHLKSAGAGYEGVREEDCEEPDAVFPEDASDGFWDDWG